MSIFKLILYISIVWLFLGCDTVQIEQEDNRSTPISTTILEINNEENITDIKPTTVNSNNININTEEETQYIDNVIDITPTPFPTIKPIPTPTPTQTPTLEEPKNYKTKFINENRCNQIIDKEFFKICYDYSLKVAKSVVYTLEGDLVNEINIKERPSFYQEESIDKQYRAKSSDYTHSGYDRGHLAPDAAFDWSEESLEATYSLANIIPQVPEVNRHMWIKVEAYARDKAVDLGEITVVNVVKYDNNNLKYIGDDNISVSIGYYKILFNTEESYEECFYYTNDINTYTKDDNLSKHKINCKSII
ncbi:MAG: DNA/RNA non-specific endonuclease [Sulfurovaceae bacterium]|nr:DNA/RNA non-specific endonuclease [Sulfurovaceae bacterium]